MPFIGQLSDAAVDAILADAYPRRREPGWRRSRKGNLTRGSPSGRTLTVFKRYEGWFQWSIKSGCKTTFSDRLYRTQMEAMRAVIEATGDWK